MNLCQMTTSSTVTVTPGEGTRTKRFFFSDGEDGCNYEAQRHYKMQAPSIIPFLQSTDTIASGYFDN